MKILDRYIGINIIQSYILVMVILAILFSLLVFIEQLDQLGEGRYQMADAVTYTIATIPRRSTDLMSITALMGSIIALGSLAGSNELTAMRCAGISKQRIGWSAIKTGILIMVFTILLEQFVVPPLDQFAESRRSLVQSEDQIALRTSGGFWSHDNLRFINVRNVIGGRQPADIDIYEFDQQGKLKDFIHADQAEILGDSRWQLANVSQKSFDPPGSITHHHDQLLWHSFLSASQVGILVVPPDNLSPTDLYSYIESLKRRGENINRYELSLWQKLAEPVVTGLMVLLSLPFVMGLSRNSTVSQRVMIAAIVGMVFYLLNQMAGYLGLLLSITPVLVVLFPIMLMLLVASILFRRIN